MSDSQPDLIAECLSRGLKDDEFIVFRVVPEFDEDMVW